MPPGSQIETGVGRLSLQFSPGQANQFKMNELLAGQSSNAMQTKTPGPLEASGRLAQFAYADFFKSAENRRIFPRCSKGTHFTFGLNRAGM